MPAVSTEVFLRSAEMFERFTEVPGRSAMVSARSIVTTIRSINVPYGTQQEGYHILREDYKTVLYSRSSDPLYSADYSGM